MKKLLTILYYMLVQADLNAQTPIQIIDETYLDSSFKEFVTALNSAIQKNDINLLRPLLADSVRESNDGCGYCPKKDFINYMFLNNPRSQDAWGEWKDVLRYGFYRVNDNEFHAPSYNKFLNQDSSLIILGTNVNIREKPGLEGRILLQSSFERFECDCYVITMTDRTVQTINKDWWHEIKLKDGRKGYVLFNFTSEKILRELVVRRINNKWRITSFYMPPGC